MWLKLKRSARSAHKEAQCFISVETITQGGVGTLGTQVECGPDKTTALAPKLFPHEVVWRLPLSETYCPPAEAVFSSGICRLALIEKWLCIPSFYPSIKECLFSFCS